MSVESKNRHAFKHRLHGSSNILTVTLQVSMCVSQQVVEFMVSKRKIFVD